MHDEQLNTLTHAFGLFLSVFGLCILWDTTQLGCLVYLLSLVSVYLFSTLSHATVGRKQHWFKRLDKGCIFFLIAGTYTPLVLAQYNNAHGYTLLVQIWTFAIIGFIAKVVYRHESVISYVLLGWCPILFSPGLLNAPVYTLGLVFLGGMAYTTGLYFFFNDHKYAFHSVWHLCVIAGSALQFAAIYTVY